MEVSLAGASEQMRSGAICAAGCCAVGTAGLRLSAFSSILRALRHDRPGILPREEWMVPIFRTGLVGIGGAWQTSCAQSSEAKGLEYSTVLVDNYGARASWIGGQTPQVQWPSGQRQGESMDIIKALEPWRKVSA